MRKTFLYKGFYLSTCKTKDWKTPWVGTLYSKKFNNSKEVFYPKNVIYEFGEESLISTMKKEVDKFLTRHREYLLWKIESIKERLSNKISELNFTEQSLEE